MHALRSELIRIWRPAFFTGIGVIALAAAIVSIFIFSSPRTRPLLRCCLERTSAFTVAEIASPGSFLAALSTLSTLAGLILLVLWAIAAATDYGTGVILILVQAPRTGHAPGRQDRRAERLRAARHDGTTLVVVVFARPLARLEGVEVEAWRTDFPSHLLEGFFDFTVAGLVGLMVSRSPARPRRGHGYRHRIGFLLVVEGLITIFAPDVGPYLPGGRSAPSPPAETTNSPGAPRRAHHALGVVAATVSLAVYRTPDIVS